VGDAVADEDEDVAAGVGEVAAQPASPTSARLSAAAAIQPPRLFESSRRTPDFSLEAASVAGDSLWFDLLYFMMELLCIWDLFRGCQPFQ
jgi:hypothetical protein